MALGLHLYDRLCQLFQSDSFLRDLDLEIKIPISTHNSSTTLLRNRFVDGWWKKIR
jgi:hypothetical protein